MKKHIVLWVIATMLSVCAKAQQDTQFSQYIFNGIYINPAYTGYKEDVFIQSYYRSQWVGVNGAPQSFSLAADGAVNDGRVGLGAMINSDQIGAQSALNAYINYAYRIRVGQDETSHLAFGLAAGLMQLGINGSKLNAITPGDMAVPVASQTMFAPDANVGIYYANERYFMGVSATNILARLIHHNSADNMLVPIPKMHFYFTAGTFIPINDDVKVKPVVLIKDDFKGPTTLDVDGFILMSERLSFGAFYRSSIKLYAKNNLQTDLPRQNAFGAIAELFATPSLRIGYSYDHSINSLGTYNYGSHELSVGFYLNSSSSADRGNRCYKF
jgi:type IX secretion system PorP/SprF family membrane protein